MLESAAATGLRARGGTYAGLFMVTLSTLMYEIGLTRIFSVTMWYHFAFVAISVALFGMTIGALIVHYWPQRFPDEHAPHPAVEVLAPLRGGDPALLHHPARPPVLAPRDRRRPLVDPRDVRDHLDPVRLQRDRRGTGPHPVPRAGQPALRRGPHRCRDGLCRRSSCCSSTSTGRVPSSRWPRSPRSGRASSRSTPGASPACGSRSSAVVVFGGFAAVNAYTAHVRQRVAPGRLGEGSARHQSRRGEVERLLAGDGGRNAPGTRPGS